MCTEINVYCTCGFSPASKLLSRSSTECLKIDCTMPPLKQDPFKALFMISTCNRKQVCPNRTNKWPKHWLWHIIFAPKKKFIFELQAKKLTSSIINYLHNIIKNMGTLKCVHVHSIMWQISYLKFYTKKSFCKCNYYVRD